MVSSWFHQLLKNPNRGLYMDVRGGREFVFVVSLSFAPWPYGIPRLGSPFPSMIVVIKPELENR
jgi:hypothetical protein